MPQDVFDAMVLTKIALANKLGPSRELRENVVEMATAIQRMYSGEDVSALITDVDAASAEVEKFVDIIHEGAFGPESADPTRTRNAVIMDFLKVSVQHANSKKPFLKRLFKGARFNFEKRPIADRVERCVEKSAGIGLFLTRA